MTKDKINIVTLSYLNTLPFLFGVKKDLDLMSKINVRCEYPSLCADLLKSGEADIGLIPVVELLQLNNPKIIGDFCIGSVGKVNTVMLYSYCPLEEIKIVSLDYQSRTSVILIQILFEKYWNINIDYCLSSEGYIDSLSDTHAGLVIGDRAFYYKDKFPYAYDLSEEWLKFTGLPFVFACWVSMIPLNISFENQLCNALKFGVSRIQDVAQEYKNKFISGLNLRTYFNNDISYNLDESKRMGMDLFLKYCKDLKNI